MGKVIVFPGSEIDNDILIKNQSVEMDVRVKASNEKLAQCVEILLHNIHESGLADISEKEFTKNVLIAVEMIRCAVWKQNGWVHPFSVIFQKMEKDFLSMPIKEYAQLLGIQDDNWKEELSELEDFLNFLNTFKDDE
jgi:hypothetical protein